MGGWVDGWMGGWVDGWMRGWVDGQRKMGLQSHGEIAAMADEAANAAADVAELVDQMAKFLELPIDPAYRPGVIANLERSATIAQLVLEFPISDQIEAAPTFQP